MRVILLLTFVGMFGCSSAQLAVTPQHPNSPFRERTGDLLLRIATLAESDKSQYIGTYAGWWPVFPGDTTTLDLRPDGTFTWTPVEIYSMASDDGSGEFVGFDVRTIVVEGGWRIGGGSIWLRSAVEWQGRLIWQFYVIKFDHQEILVPDILLASMLQRSQAAYQEPTENEQDAIERRKEAALQCGYRKVLSEEKNAQPAATDNPVDAQ